MSPVPEDQANWLLIADPYNLSLPRKFEGVAGRCTTSGLTELGLDGNYRVTDRGITVLAFLRARVQVAEAHARVRDVRCQFFELRQDLEISMEQIGPIDDDRLQLSRILIEQSKDLLTSARDLAGTSAMRIEESRRRLEAVVDLRRVEQPV